MDIGWSPLALQAAPARWAEFAAPMVNSRLRLVDRYQGVACEHGKDPQPWDGQWLFFSFLALFAALVIQAIDAPAHQKSFWLCRLIVYYGAQPANFAVEH
jgi:hypothetical protein